MSHKNPFLAAFFAVALEAMSSSAAGALPVKEIQVTGPRITLSEVVPTVPASVATADLGPAPAPGGSRVVTQEELRTAATGASAKVIASLPAAVRVVRKMKKLTAADVERETRKAVIAAGLRRGVAIAAVRAPKSSDVAEGFTTIVASVPKPPRRTGRVPTTATLTFQRGTEILARIAVPIDLDLSAEAAVPDIAKGAAVTVTVKSGLVEISASALAGADADVGEDLPVTLRPSGKILRATLVAPGKAVIAAPTSAPSVTDTPASTLPTAAPSVAPPAPSIPAPATLSSLPPAVSVPPPAAPPSVPPVSKRLSKRPTARPSTPSPSPSIAPGGST